MRKRLLELGTIVIVLLSYGCTVESGPGTTNEGGDVAQSSDILKCVCTEWGKSKDYVQSKMQGFELIDNKAGFLKYKQKTSKDFISYSFEDGKLTSSVALIHYKNGELLKPDFSDYRFLGGIPYFENGEAAIHEVYSNLDDETLMVFYEEFPQMDFYCAVGFAPNMQTSDDYSLKISTGIIEEKGTNKVKVALSTQDERVKDCTRGAAYWYYTFLKDSSPLILTHSSTHSYNLSDDGASVVLVNMDDDVRYSYCEFVALNGVVFWGNENNFYTQKMSSGSVGSHDWIDLGLPSGTKWARCNVNASIPEDNGYYYSWGDIKGIDHYPSSAEASWSSYRFYSDGLTKYIFSNTGKASGATIDNKTELDLQDDVAYQKWGDKWRIPNWVQMKELIDECRWELGVRAGVKGAYVYGKTNGYENNYIFLPFERENSSRLSYWTRSLWVEYKAETTNQDIAVGTYSTTNFQYLFLDDISRRIPFNIRPVLRDSNSQ